MALVLPHCERWQRTLNTQTIFNTPKLHYFCTPLPWQCKNPSSEKFNTIPAHDHVAPVCDHDVPSAASTSSSSRQKSTKITGPPHQESQEVAMNRHTKAPDLKYLPCIAGTIYFRHTTVITRSAGSRSCPDTWWPSIESVFDAVRMPSLIVLSVVGRRGREVMGGTLWNSRLKWWEGEILWSGTP